MGIFVLLLIVLLVIYIIEHEGSENQQSKNRLDKKKNEIELMFKIKDGE